MRRAIFCVAICTTLGCGTTSPSSSRDGGSGGDAPSVIPANPCAGIEPPAQGPMLEYVVQQGDRCLPGTTDGLGRSEEHTSELQSRGHLVCRLLLEKN